VGPELGAEGNAGSIPDGSIGVRDLGETEVMGRAGKGLGLVAAHPGALA
jgi:hypothetical protein